jgi:hypothetical protein
VIAPPEDAAVEATGESAEAPAKPSKLDELAAKSQPKTMQGSTKGRQVVLVDEDGNETPVPASTTIVKDGSEGAKMAAELGREPGSDDDKGDDPLTDTRGRR